MSTFKCVPGDLIHVSPGAFFSDNNYSMTSTLIGHTDGGIVLAIAVVGIDVLVVFPAAIGWVMEHRVSLLECNSLLIPGRI